MNHLLGGESTGPRRPQSASSSESPLRRDLGDKVERVPMRRGLNRRRSSLKWRALRQGPPSPPKSVPHQTRRQEMTPTDLRRKIRNFPAANLLVKLAASYAAS